MPVRASWVSEGNNSTPTGALMIATVSGIATGGPPLPLTIGSPARRSSSPVAATAVFASSPNIRPTSALAACAGSAGSPSAAFFSAAASGMFFGSSTARDGVPAPDWPVLPAVPDPVAP